MGLVDRELLQVARHFPEIVGRSIAESTYGRAKIFEKCSQDAARLYQINPLFRLLVLQLPHQRVY